MSLAHILIISETSTIVGIALVSCFMYWLLKKKRKVPSTESMESEQFSPKNLIGVGSFGSVYKGILDEGGLTIAVKVLDVMRHGASKSFMAECEALRNIRHRNLLKIITSCSSVDFQGNDFKVLVYEFMPNGNLERWLHSNIEMNNTMNGLSSLNLLQRIDISIDMACALDCLHNHCEKPIIHCDLKPRKALINHDMVAHIGDFGLTRFHPRFTNTVHSSTGIK
ncbi:unnamed protein product [Ilex paraguariensis]|uniref:Protein kinase domain-containing protein n=1 Tax=Ilex paraguariensis TaxID=185542 RepID=A0ABC8QTF6_9AQUA